MSMETVYVIIYEILDAYAFLMLSAIGLAIIYGMMGIINLAHGEFIMIGAYITTALANSGIPLGISILCGTLGVAIFGGILDIILFSKLYNRALDSIVATWGLSLILSQGCLILIGPTIPSCKTPAGIINLGSVTYSIYRVMIIGIAILVPIIVYIIFKKTRFGIQSRATIQNKVSAAYLGSNTRKIYSITFMIGSAFAGLVGGLYAPTYSMSPTMGGFFQLQSFVAVIVGGLNPLIGAVSASVFLGTIQGIISIIFNSYYARMALLLIAIIILRIMPRGISAYIEKKRESRMGAR
jgi:branched-subunit amino acid ABC-type transport system permease component